VRILLDESLPGPLAKLLTGHDVHTVTVLQWTGLKNGDLLKRAADSFDAVLTADQNIQFQQNLAQLPTAVVVLVASTNRIESLQPLVSEVLSALETLQPRTLIRVGA
jgi:predicted nuclease of predicted toxin-antitoxin system